MKLLPSVGAALIGEVAYQETTSSPFLSATLAVGSFVLLLCSLLTISVIHLYFTDFLHWFQCRIERSHWIFIQCSVVLGAQLHEAFASLLDFCAPVVLPIASADYFSPVVLGLFLFFDSSAIIVDL